MINLVGFDTVIGLEVHCQLSTKTKLFCSCSTAFGAQTNANTCAVCLGLPGALPVLNLLAVKKAIMLAEALEGSVAHESVFDRKQYFYQDLPKGYQISQFDKPYCEGGQLTLGVGKVIRLRRIHLEEDAGKSVHRQQGTMIDLNRAGIPLVEIVSEPDLSSPLEAVEYLKKLHRIVVHLGVSDGNMEEGSFRCDANISLKVAGSEILGTRCEIKNLNSFRFLEKAILFEIDRQREILETGGTVRQQTRLFDPSSGVTVAMRDKEDSDDYRYFPDPDLPKLYINQEWKKEILKSLPELPDRKLTRYLEEFGISVGDGETLIADPDLSRFFEELIHELKDVKGLLPRVIAHWVTGEFLAAKTLKGWSLANPPLTPKHLAGLLVLLNNQTLSGKLAKVVFQTMVETLEHAETIVKSHGLVQITDLNQVSVMVAQVIESHPQQLKEYLEGKDKLFAFFVGQVMRLSQGKLNPNLVQEAIKEQLSKKRGD